MKRGLGVAAVLLLIIAAIYFFPNSQKSPPGIVARATQNLSASVAEKSTAVASAATPSDGSNSQAVNSSQSKIQGQPIATIAGQLIPDANSSPAVGPETALQNVERAVRQFSEMFGGNPVGTNPEITSQLAGDNPKHINFINPQPGSRINAEGELVDAWGTPYFFHQISSSEMEIHSAGPDKIMWTSDDLVVK